MTVKFKAKVDANQDESLSSLQILIKHSFNIQVLSPFSVRRLCSREQAINERDWAVMSSVFFASQSNYFFLSSREQTRLVEISL